MKPQFKFTRYQVFGWVVHQKKIAIGETFKVLVSNDTLHSQSGELTLWVQGLATVFSPDGYLVADKLPGCFNLELPLIRASEYTVTAQRDSEWWCINYMMNKRQLPTVEPLRILRGSTQLIAPGSRLLVCGGSFQLADGTVISSGMAISVVNPDCWIVAITDCYGFIFK